MLVTYKQMMQNLYKVCDRKTLFSNQSSKMHNFLSQT